MLELFPSLELELETFITFADKLDGLLVFACCLHTFLNVFVGVFVCVYNACCAQNSWCTSSCHILLE